MSINVFDYQAPADLLAGRNILVTGASAGIGAAVAKSFAAHGATVVLLGRDTGRLEVVYDAIIAQSSPTPMLCELDFATATAAHYDALAQGIKEELGDLHGLLHNAGLLTERRSIRATKPPDWEASMQVNVNAPFLLTRALLPLMETVSDDASIVFTSSSVGRKGRAFWGAYAVAKFAIEGLMEVLADELQDTSSIRVNSLNPGATRTAMRQAAYPGEDPLTLPTAEEILPLYLYLLGRDSIGQTGKQWDTRQGSPPPV